MIPVFERLRSPKEVSYEEYHRQKLYLRWYTVDCLNMFGLSRNDWYDFWQQEPHDDNEDRETLLSFFSTVQGRFSVAHTAFRFANFENPKDAMLFKLTFG